MTFAEKFADIFEEQIKEVGDKLDSEGRVKAIRSANRVAALIEQSIRFPQDAERIKIALKMEQGILQTLLAQTTIDSIQAVRSAAQGALVVLITAALD